MNRFSRLTPAILTLALLSATPALPQARRGAAPPRSASFAEVVRGLLPEFLVRLWGDAPPVTFLSGDLGCEIDPFGRCKAASAPPVTSLTGDLGCDIDPYGRCK